MKSKTIAFCLLLLSFSAWANDSYLLEVSVSKTKIDGKKWDLNSGPPDIFVIVDGVKRFKCKNRNNCQVVFRSNKKDKTFIVSIFDKDPLSDDFIGEGSCEVNEDCHLGSAMVNIWNYQPHHNFGNCNKDLAVTFFEREFVTNLKKYRAVRDYWFTIEDCEQSTQSKIMTIVSSNWFIGSDLLNLYTSESKLFINNDGSDPRYMTLKPDSELTTTDWLIDFKKTFSNAPVIINSNKNKK